MAKLKGARDRKKIDTGKCGGRQTILERDPRIVAAAKALARGDRKLSLREIAAELETQGFVTKKGTRFAPGVIASMLEVSQVAVDRAQVTD